MAMKAGFLQIYFRMLFCECPNKAIERCEMKDNLMNCTLTEPELEFTTFQYYPEAMLVDANFCM